MKKFKVLVLVTEEHKFSKIVEVTASSEEKALEIAKDNYGELNFDEPDTIDTTDVDVQEWSELEPGNMEFECKDKFSEE